MEDFYPVLHGATTQIMMLGERWSEQGIDTVVITRRIEKDHPPTERLPGIRIVRVPPAVGLHRAGKFLMILPVLWEIVRRRREIDILLVSDLKVLGAVGVLAAGLAGVPCLLRAESLGEFDVSGWFDENRGRHPLLARLVKAAAPLRDAWLRRADGFLGISSAVVGELRGGGVSDSRIVRIPNGIDTTRFRPVDGRGKAELRRRLELPSGPIVVYTGRLSEGKGLDWLLRVWADVVREHRDAHLLIVGGGQGFGADIETRLRMAASELGIEDRVTFTGLVANVPEYLQAADIFVLPSRSENLPLSLLEAMSCGLPSVATAVGGIVDIIEGGENGLLVPYDDDAALFGALTELLGSEGLAGRLAEEGRATVLERFDIGTVAARYRDVFSTASVTTRHGPSARVDAATSGGAEPG
jgi:glycosyltransferase involved in cell wall biosynthesis